MSLILSDLSLFCPNNEKSVDDNPHAELENQDLWKAFSDIGTEMVITKVGRRMFPILRVKLSGLDKKSKYIVMVELVPSDRYRYKFTNGEWAVSGKGDLQSVRAPIVHPDSPQYGDSWMTNGASFKILKLSNDPYNTSGHTYLNSLHRYYPRIHIVRCDSFDKIIISSFKTFHFKYTDFIAVTAYQNDEITKIKIANNPFAKGFRPENKERAKRRIRISEVPPSSEVEEPSTKRLKIKEPAPVAEPPSPIPTVPVEMLAQWQLAIMSSFGGVQTALPSSEAKEETAVVVPVPVKKIGFGVSDLLGTSS
ncbi:hypothetical protein GCK72_010685 [Caenorhabditis remanei]|nr:hypothetical protein GCK72_010685 [Caenorhabditis remanei]KAF1762423.1 hypothetical protein GCK72_010685 [Caenorhabditis remanei]